MDGPLPEADDRDRCPRCGCGHSMSPDGRTGGPTCRICGHRSEDATGRRQPATALLPDPVDEESVWRAWQESIRVERWIWFAFAVGLLVAGVVGLVRVGQ